MRKEQMCTSKIENHEHRKKKNPINHFFFASNKISLNRFKFIKKYNNNSHILFKFNKSTSVTMINELLL